MENLKDFLVKYGTKIYTEREMIKLQIHIILAALFPIYIGSHAALQRPPSASPIPKSTASSSHRLGNSDPEDEEESRAPMEGLTPSDAIMFPVLASVVLGTLYFVIKWLDDPTILNKILGWYFSGMGVFGVGRLAKDSLDVGVGFIFPSVWTRGKGIFHFDQDLRCQVIEDGEGKMINVAGVTNPLPGRLSTIRFSERITSALWNIRGLLKTTYSLNLHIKTLLPHYKTSIKFTSVLGLGIGITTITAYNLLNAPWYLTNIMGFAFCYGSLQLLSPTTFFTGTLVLMGLFFYDITMVFYTPLMVTVATSLDVPIKLVFPLNKNGGGSMLGLGDIVLPGILVALALRFDLYLHYLYLQKSSPFIPTTNSKSNTTSNSKSINESLLGPSSIQKTTYKPSTGLWGERFWTSSFSPSSSSSSSSNRGTGIEGTRFSKPYFKAALVGYITGMITTLIVMRIFNHAQPALLYLVPGVVGSLWGTAVVRGELGLMWRYTEDGSLDEEGKKEEGKDQGKSIEGEEKENKEEKKSLKGTKKRREGDSKWRRKQEMKQEENQRSVKEIQTLRSISMDQLKRKIKR
ncbi:cd5341ff-1c31-4519-b1c5-948eca9f6bf0 [Sclerotinia trifoliorum]|uniref:Cd5341ff-1c31-4519-b1c5-948eca9f6bf0 n=1 Tax=Sclerotinia trifoliorum TaxID=28548 RepID=A0A8H2ZPH3_9HELO|nr:cd5341ff-1c31-4519-b1c5-948eca9f6bf0 [Sclerotinia trifoliorum]